MKKTAWDFGSHWEAQHACRRLDEPAETTCDSEQDYLGFRLAHDDENRVPRGGSWINSAGSARAARRCWSLPGYRLAFLGLRLAFDREDT